MSSPPVADPRASRGASSTGARNSDRPQVLFSPRARKPHAGFPAILGIAIVAAILLPFIVFGGAYRYVSSEAEVIQTEKTDAIVVLGQRSLMANLHRFSRPVWRTRLSCTAMGLHHGSSPSAVKQNGDRFTEAGVGREWLITNGVPSSDVIAAKDGSNTRESMIMVAELAAKNNWTSITLDSDPAHMARSRAMANRLGFDVHEPHSVWRWKSADQ